MDNLFLFGFNDSCLTDIQDQLNAQFKMTNLGKISHYLGMEVDIKVGKKIFFCQTIYLRKILVCFQIIDYNPTSVFMSQDVANFLFSFDS